MLNIEDSFAKLKFEWDQKSADIAALEVQRRAAGLRLDDALKREAEAQAALKRVTAELEAARKHLSDAGRAADKVMREATQARDHILFDAHQEAEEFLKNIRSAVATAATMIKQHKQEK
jgi:hypothetical protein